MYIKFSLFEYNSIFVDIDHVIVLINHLNFTHTVDILYTTYTLH